MASKTTSYQDPIYDQITLTPLQIDLLDLPELQRLADVKQLAFKYMVYVGATHTRKEHSTGVAYMAGRIGKQLDLGKQEIELVIGAGQLHDIAHMPFSHTLERITSHNHMEYAPLAFEGKLFPDRSKPTINEVLNDYGIKPQTLLELIDGKYDKNQHLQQIIKSPVDADQMDYLKRDAKHTGHEAGLIRDRRLLQTMKIHEEKIVFREKGMGAIEHMFYARKAMYEAVYHHPVAVAPEAMLAKATRQIVNQLKPEELIRQRDYEFLTLLKESGDYPAEIVKRLNERNLFKRAFEIPSHDGYKHLRGNVIELAKQGNDKIETEIANEANVNFEDLVVEFPIKVSKLEDRMNQEENDNKINEKLDVDILMRTGEIKKISELRPLARAILKEDGIPNIFTVYADKDIIDKVKNTVNNIYFDGMF